MDAMASAGAHEAASGRRSHALLCGAVLMAFGAFAFVRLSWPVLDEAWRLDGWVRSSALVDGTRFEDGKVYADYRYRWNGVERAGHRVRVVDGDDPFGASQKPLHEALERARRERRSVPVWVDPHAPHRAVLYRSLPVGGLMLVAAFGLVPLLGGAAWASCGQLAGRGGGGHFAERTPWRRRRAWSGAPLRSDARARASTWTLIAVGVNALAWGGLLSFLNEGTEPPIRIVMWLSPFLVAGLTMAVLVVRTLVDLRRRGPTPLTLSPFPGTLGGEVRGCVSLPPSARAGTVARVRLEGVRVSGGRGGRSATLCVRERIVAVRVDGGGAYAAFALDAPGDVPPSDVSRTAPRHAWYLTLELEAIGLRRGFEVPVFPDTGHHVHDVVAAVSPSDVVVPVRTSAARTLGAASTDGGKALEWREGLSSQKAWQAAGLAFAAYFVWLGGDIALREQEAFGWAVAGLGLVVGIAMVGLLGVTRRVRLDGDALRVRRHWFGRFERAASLRPEDARRVEVVAAGGSSGPYHSRAFFEVRVGDSKGARHVIAAGVDGRERAEEVATMLREWAGR